MTLKKALGKCIKLVEEDLNRYAYAQQQDPKAFGVSEARAVKDYLTALAGAYRAAAGVDLNKGDIEASTEDIENELIDRLREEND